MTAEHSNSGDEPLDDLPEISDAVVQEIKSARRLVSHARAEQAVALFKQSAVDLWRTVKIAATVEPKSANVTTIAAADALHDIGGALGLGDDDIQRIISVARETPEAICSEINGARLERVTPKPKPKGKTRDKWKWSDETMGAQELCDQRFPDVRFIVPGLFPEGVSLLVSRPKLGKSWLFLQVGSAVANGVGVLAGMDQPLHGDVLYLALEDNKRRLQRRFTKYFGANSECWPKRLEFAIRWKRLDQGGLEAIREWCALVEKPTLILIDTLKKVRPPKKANQSEYDADYEACEGLKTLGDEWPGLGIWAAHHDRKMAAEDVFDTVSGTLGLIGGVDTVAILKRNAQGVTLHIEGRDLVESVEKAIRFDRETCRWVVLGDAAEIYRSEERNRVLAALKGAMAGLSVNEIKAAADIRSRDAADKLLQRMAGTGEITRLGRGKYRIALHPLSEESEKPS